MCRLKASVLCFKTLRSPANISTGGLAGGVANDMKGGRGRKARRVASSATISTIRSDIIGAIENGESRAWSGCFGNTLKMKEAWAASFILYTLFLLIFVRESTCFLSSKLQVERSARRLRVRNHGFFSKFMEDLDNFIEDATDRKLGNVRACRDSASPPDPLNFSDHFMSPSFVRVQVFMASESLSFTERTTP